MANFLLFTTGGGSSDPLNWDGSEAALYKVEDLKGIKPASHSSLDLFFETFDGKETVTLNIKNGAHTIIMSAISKILNSPQPVVSIADVDKNIFVHKDIYSVTIKTSTPILYKNKITDATTVEIIDINTKTKKLMSMTLANVHSADATVQVYLLDAGGILYYIIKDVVIPTGVTLKLDSNELDYDASVFNLYVKLGGSTPVDVIVR